ncbi:nitroreductase family protein [Haloferula rosea]|uniref:Nitroreductase family protein n=1 Tax=Haloferula rosea TaxID=490093 RepID=A0A934VBW5_9BACT|nr:nitroreductase family protein [Haloferula rosea]MBK1827808.1 nitroreductase family protein [Haloferula rosea]
MKSFIKSVRARLRYYHECYQDAKRFIVSISPKKLGPELAVARIESDIVRQYHVIEKGLCMPDFRPGFGQDVVRGLVRSLQSLEQHPFAGVCVGGQIEAARATLREYDDRHRSIGFDVSEILRDEDRHMWANAPEREGGIRPFEPCQRVDAGAFERVVRGRASVRDFDPERIPSQDKILSCIELALRAPSVCNRQTARVHVFAGHSAQKVLSHQSGNRGFGHKVPMVLVVTSDLRYFTGTVERYQGWIDGGMFSMLLLLALQAAGLGAVALNWSVRNETDRSLRVDADLPEHERVIMLIGCGYPKEGCRVPVSARRAASDVTTWNL